MTTVCTRGIARAGILAAVMLSCTPAPAPDAPTLDLPPRPERAPGATQIVEAIRDVDLRRREQSIYELIANGNVPTWLRRLQPVEMTGDVDGVERSVTFWVTPDYLAVGSDADHLVVPLSTRTARRVAELANASLPTARMVDAIWQTADVRLAPIRIEPDDERGSMRYVERHDNLIGAQRSLRRVEPGTFVAGHKVDVVLSPTLAADDGNATVYGWHQTDGRPIQSLFTSPTDSLVVFNHAVRLVHRTVLVDGVERDLRDVLADPALGPILRGAAAGPP